MKTTVTINLNGKLFHIDEDAYLKLKAYLDDIESRISDPNEVKEVIKDIEMRMAELFEEKLSQNKRQSIHISDVENVMYVMGTPEEITGNKQKKSRKQEQKQNYSSNSKRLFRDPDNRVIGGVCSGLGEYWNVDPVLLRVLFLLVFLTAGFGLLIYLILWLVIPEANTLRKKREMRGEVFV